MFSDVCFGPKNLGFSDEEIKKRAEEALRLVKLDEKFWKQSPFELSGGQKRRVAIAGVLAMGPENVTVHTLALKKGSTLMERRDVIPGGDQVARMLDFSLDALRGAGYAPYYLYRQKYMSGSLENVGWARPGTESLYNIVMMEELQTVVSIGGGGVTKLVDPAAGRILRLPNPKYPHDYLAARDKILAQKDEIVSFYGG